MMSFKNLALTAAALVVPGITCPWGVVLFFFLMPMIFGNEKDAESYQKVGAPISPI